MLLAHLDPTWILLTIHKGGPFVFGSLLLLDLLLKDHLTLLHFLLLHLLLQVGDEEQAKCGCGRRRGREEIGRSLGFKHLLG